MRFIYNAGGANLPAIKEFEVTPEAEIYEGQVVLASGGVIDEGVSSGIVIGVAAETHTGKEEFLNKRANSKALRVNIAPDAVYETKAIRLSAVSGGNTTSIKCKGTGFGASVTSGKLILKQKAQGSTNTDKVGDERAISATAVSGETITFTVSEGGAAAAGDIYEFYPVLGDEGKVSSDAFGYAPVNNSTEAKLICVGYDTDNGKVFVKLCNTLFC